jgi:23S rRNA pseudouridine2605 synthase
MTEDSPAPVRIAKALARAGIASRRGAEALIAAGRVAVNGRVIDSPALNVTPHDRIAWTGSPWPSPHRRGCGDTTSRLAW